MTVDSIDGILVEGQATTFEVLGRVIVLVMEIGDPCESVVH